MATNENLDNLVINILSTEQYDSIEEKSSSELYIVKQDATDGDNAIASRTYADVGRDAVIVSLEEPNAEKSRLWINPAEEAINPDNVVYVSPADTDLDNITDKAKKMIESPMIAEFDAGFNITEGEGYTWTAPSNGYIYGYAGFESSLVLKYKNANGVKLMNISTSTLQGLSDNIVIGEGQTIYIYERKGTIELAFYPFKGVIND